MTIQENPNDYTPDEPWAVDSEPGEHQYNAQAIYVQEALGPGSGKCLVIGSPIFEAKALQFMGWNVTYCDVREPPVHFDTFLHGDATNIDFGANEFDAASSTCVLCHAGTGRYGDEKDDNADEKILANVYRALKPKARFVVMFGPVFNMQNTGMLNNVHRIYTLRDAVGIVGKFKIVAINIFDITTGKWTNKINNRQMMDCDYLSMVLEK